MMTSSASAVASASVTTSAFSSSSSSSSNSPCAACKFLRRKCQPDCVFAPYFPPDQPQKFAHVHKVFGASNVTKLLNELSPYQREDAVNSLAYEADMRLRDPVYGCVGVISILQHQLRQLQIDLARAKSELCKYQAATTTVGVSAGVGNGLIHANHPNGIEFFGASAQPAAARDGHLNQLMMMNHDSEMAARIGVHGVCDAGIMAAMNNMSAVNVGPFGFQFPKPRTAGIDERQAIGPS